MVRAGWNPSEKIPREYQKRLYDVATSTMESQQKMLASCPTQVGTGGVLCPTSLPRPRPKCPAPRYPN